MARHRPHRRPAESPEFSPCLRHLQRACLGLPCGGLWTAPGVARASARGLPFRSPRAVLLASAVRRAIMEPGDWDAEPVNLHER